MSPASAESCPEGGGQEGHAHITCECQQAADRRRCSASPEPEGREGKENKEWDGCGAKGSLDKQQPECEESRGPVFPDDDSNQILPVEQFFGNMDIVQVRSPHVSLMDDQPSCWVKGEGSVLQDFPPREPKGSGHAQRESRRRHFYAREDSDDEADAQRQDGGDT